MKRNCNECFALKKSWAYGTLSCLLGKNIEITKRYYDIEINAKPLD